MDEIKEAPDDRYAGVTRQDVEQAIMIAERTRALSRDVDQVYEAWNALCAAVAVLAAGLAADRRRRD